MSMCVLGNIFYLWVSSVNILITDLQVGEGDNPENSTKKWPQLLLLRTLRKFNLSITFEGKWYF